MKLIIITLIAVQIIQMIISQAVYPSFQDYLRVFEKHYLPGEFEKRQTIYNANIAKFSEIKDFTPGVNKFTDWTPEEIEKIKNLKVELPDNKTSSKIPDVVRRVGAPLNFDWRQRQAITSIKDQGNCGSCWAFAATAHAESQLIIQERFNNSIDLSEQYELQCTSRSDCNGGYLIQATQAALNLPLELAYPYNPNNFTIYGTKTVDCSYPDRINIAGNYSTYYYLSDSDIISLLLQSPLIIAISAYNWQYYRDGVFSCINSRYIPLDHAVLLIGYTPTYWIIKNQWGDHWGMQGYMYVTRSANNNCKIGLASTRMFGKGDSSNDQKYKDIIKNSTDNSTNNTTNNTTNNSTDNNTDNSTDNTTNNTTDNSTDNSTDNNTNNTTNNSTINNNTNDKNDTNTPNNTIIPIYNDSHPINVTTYELHLRIFLLLFIICLLIGLS